jgi:FixJ family two-component response regulator
MAEEPTVFVVDDDAAVRDSMKALLGSVGLRTEVFPSAEAFLAAWDPSRPGCLLLDVRMPGINGPTLQRTLQERGAAIPIVFITGYADVPTAVAAMKLGAVDFLEKPWTDEALLDRVRQALARDAEWRSERGRLSEAASRIDRLTPRERDILNLVLQGKSSREIAEAIFRTEKTVEFHRRNILRKLGIRRTVQLRQILGGVPPSHRTA